MIKSLINFKHESLFPVTVIGKELRESHNFVLKYHINITIVLMS